MSLLVMAGLTTLGIALGRGIVAFARRSTAGATALPAQPAGLLGASATPLPPGGATAAEAFAVFPCAQGDVVLRSDGREAWLAGAQVFSEAAALACLFQAPEARGDVFVYALAQSKDLWWLAQVTPESVGLTAEPLSRDLPSVVAAADQVFERVRRVPLSVASYGETSVHIGAEALVAEYTGKHDMRLLLILGTRGLCVFSGELLQAFAYEVLPGTPSA
jgi:hypothetical protein